MNESKTNAIIILAAGESSRMGQPKQLLQLNGKPLLRRAAEEAIRTRVGPILVVLGAFFEQMEEALHGLPVKTILNPDWQQGMGTSIRQGVTEVQKYHDYCEGAIIMLADQPYADASLLKKLLDTYHISHKPIIASAYNGILGVPAYFHHSCFVSLTELEGEAGARKLIQQWPEEVKAIPFPLGNIDVDTPEDYAMVKEKIEGKR